MALYRCSSGSGGGGGTLIKDVVVPYNDTVSYTVKDGAFFVSSYQGGVIQGVNIACVIDNGVFEDKSSSSSVAEWVSYTGGVLTVRCKRNDYVAKINGYYV